MMPPAIGTFAARISSRWKQGTLQGPRIGTRVQAFFQSLEKWSQKLRGGFRSVLRTALPCHANNADALRVLVPLVVLEKRGFHDRFSGQVEAIRELGRALIRGLAYSDALFPVIFTHLVAPSQCPIGILPGNCTPEQSSRNRQPVVDNTTRRSILHTMKTDSRATEKRLQRDEQIRVSLDHSKLVGLLADMFGVSKKMAAGVAIEEAYRRAKAGDLVFTIKPKAVTS